ncbi:MAG: hypothetical protein ABIE94_03585 [archaeon]
MPIDIAKIKEKAREACSNSLTDDGRIIRGYDGPWPISPREMELMAPGISHVRHINKSVERGGYHHEINDGLVTYETTTTTPLLILDPITYKFERAFKGVKTSSRKSRPEGKALHKVLRTRPVGVTAGLLEVLADARDKGGRLIGMSVAMCADRVRKLDDKYDRTATHDILQDLRYTLPDRGLAYAVVLNDGLWRVEDVLTTTSQTTNLFCGGKDSVNLEALARTVFVPSPEFTERLFGVRYDVEKLDKAEKLKIYR